MWPVADVVITNVGGKSGQHRAPCFLTGRDWQQSVDAEENNRLHNNR